MKLFRDRLVSCAKVKTVEMSAYVLKPVKYVKERFVTEKS